MKNMLLLLVVVGMVTGTGLGLTVYDPNYRGDVWIEYSSADMGACNDFAFDHEGRVYTSHTIPPEDYYGQPAGAIYTVSPDGPIDVLVGDLMHPCDILWSDNAYFGEGLLIANQLGYSPEPYNNPPADILQLLPDGTISSITDQGLFYGFKEMVLGEGLIHDRYLYIARENEILRYSPESDWLYPYAYLPNAYEAKNIAMAFDTAGSYGGHMFAAVDNIYYQYNQPTGLVTIINQGGQDQAMPYSNQIEMACGIAFDTTAQQEFGGAMYVIERRLDETQWSLSRVIDPETIELVAVFDKHTTDVTPPRILFGADGALYALEANTAAETTVISRIYKFKTPLELAIEHLGNALAKDQQLLEGIESSLHEKRIAQEHLEAALAGGELTVKKAESQAMLRELKKAIVAEEDTRQTLLNSIENIETLLSMLSLDS